MMKSWIIDDFQCYCWNICPDNSLDKTKGQTVKSCEECAHFLVNDKDNEFFQYGVMSFSNMEL